MAKTTTTTSKAKPAGKVKPFRARIRMYRHGLGDCFLLSFPKGGAGVKKGDLAHVLIDCGIIGGTPNPSKRMEKVAADVAKMCGDKLDVVVVTHEHWDHLSGFTQAQKIWEGVEFENVWLAWTEKRDALTEELRRNILVRKVASLSKAVEKAKKAAAAAANAVEEVEAKATGEKKTKELEAAEEALAKFDKKAQGLAAVAGFFGEAGEGEAMDGKQLVTAFDFVKNRAKATEYLSPNDVVKVPGAPGVRVYVMGPPKSEAALRAEDPSEEEGYHKLAMEALAMDEMALGAVEASVSDEEEFRAFDARWGLAVDAPGKGESAGMQAMREAYARDDWRKIDDGWAGAAERLALQMDQGTNNTSLVLAFELVDTREVLLFVGDAQAGNWRSWDECNWTVNGRKESAEGLLQRTVFYKVGHHGSHNATMRVKGIVRMENLKAAFIPVDKVVAHKAKGWEKMPLEAIREALDEKCEVVFEGDEDKADNSGRWESGGEIEQIEENLKYKKGGKEPKVMTSTKKRTLFTDYFLR